MKKMAHRGYSAKYPENTMKAFKEAYKRGFDGIETDVHLTLDQELVLIHDETIDRTSNGKGYISDFTLETLKEYRFNNGFDENETIPTLKELLEYLKDKDMILNIELKTDKIHYYGIEKKVVDLVNQMNMQEKVIYSSFYLPSILKIREYQPDAYIGYLIEEDYEKKKKELLEYNIHAVHPKYTFVKQDEEVKKLKEMHQTIAVWTVKNQKVYGRCLRQGIDMIFSNEYFE